MIILEQFPVVLHNTVCVGYLLEVSVQPSHVSYDKRNLGLHLR